MINADTRSILLVLMLLEPLLSQPINISGLDEYIHSNMDYFNVPGLSIAVVKDDRVILSKGYGFRENGTAEHVDENTRKWNCRAC